MSEPVIQQVDGVTLAYVSAPKVVVFSHGFGVRRDTSGFFTELAANLPEGFDRGLLTSIPDNEIITVEGANNNFAGKSRQPLIRTIKAYL